MLCLRARLLLRHCRLPLPRPHLLEDEGRASNIAGDTFGEVESTKSVSDVYAPFDGTVTARNEALDANPELVNSDPYGDGWLVEISPAGGADAALSQSGLLDAAGYEALTGDQG